MSMGSIKVRYMGMALGIDKYPQKEVGIGVGTDTIVPDPPHTRTHTYYEHAQIGSLLINLEYNLF